MNRSKLWELYANKICDESKGGQEFSGSAKCEKESLFILCK